MSKKKETSTFQIVLTIFLILALITGIIFFFTWYFENQKEVLADWEEKYKPICEEYGMLYLEQGSVHSARCYKEDNGILTPYLIKEKLGKYYLMEPTK